MGLVESRRDESCESGTTISGLKFYVEDRLKELTEMYGSIVVDFRKDFWMNNFVISFLNLTSSC